MISGAFLIYLYNYLTDDNRYKHRYQRAENYAGHEGIHCNVTSCGLFNNRKAHVHGCRTGHALDIPRNMLSCFPYTNKLTLVFNKSNCYIKVSRLIGSPPGYVGYDEAGQLSEKVRRKPYSVVLFDEIEKAHPDVMNILLQILDEGKTNDAQGRTVSFENAVIIMTSNAGSENRENLLGFGKDKDTAVKDKAMKALRQFLRPEFLGRVDEIIVFNQLTKEDYEKISKLLIDEFIPSLRDKGIKFVVDEDVPSVVANDADGGVRGARDIRHTIRKAIEDPIANILVANFDRVIDEIRVSVHEGKIVVSHS